MSPQKRSGPEVPRWFRCMIWLMVIAGVATGAGSVASASAPQSPRACIEFQALTKAGP
jgi:hypothetical protein